MKIRKGNLKDILHIKRCLVDSWVEHAKQVPDLLDENRMRNSDVEAYYEKCLKSNNCLVLIAEVDGKFSGFQRADVQEISKFFKHSKILYLDDVYVLPEFRKMGIARALVLEVEKIARKRGIKRLQSRIYTFNKPAQNLLKSLGYTMPHSTWDKTLE